MLLFGIAFIQFVLDAASSKFMQQSEANDSKLASRKREETTVQGWTVALVSKRAVPAAIRQQRELLWQNQGQR